MINWLARYRYGRCEELAGASTGEQEAPLEKARLSRSGRPPAVDECMALSGQRWSVSTAGERDSLSYNQIATQLRSLSLSLARSRSVSLSL